MVTGTVPHPLDVGRDRTTPEHTVSLPHRERATHAYLGWRLPLRDALEMELSAGASYFSLRRGVIASLIPGETGGPPFAEVALQVDTGEHTRNGAGFNAGVDITYMLTSPAYIPQLGVGYFARVTSGFVSIPLSADSWRRETVGGIQTGDRVALALLAAFSKVLAASPRLIRPRRNEARDAAGRRGSARPATAG